MHHLFSYLVLLSPMWVVGQVLPPLWNQLYPQTTFLNLRTAWEPWSKLPVESLLCKYIVRLRGYKTSFMLNSAEHEIMKFVLLINKFILAEYRRTENFSANKYENANYCWHFYIYWQRQFHAQLNGAWKKFHDPRFVCLCWGFTAQSTH